MASLVEWCTTELLVIGKARGNATISFKGRDVELCSESSMMAQAQRLIDRKFYGIDRHDSVRRLQQLVQRSVDLCRLLYRSSFLQRHVPSAASGGGGGGGLAQTINGMLSAPPATSANVASIELSLMSEEVDFLDELCRALRSSIAGIEAMSTHYTLEKDTKVTMQLDKIIETIHKTLGWCEPAVQSLSALVRNGRGDHHSTAPLSAPLPLYTSAEIPQKQQQHYSGGGSAALLGRSAPSASRTVSSPINIGGGSGKQQQQSQSAARARQSSSRVSSSSLSPTSSSSSSSSSSSAAAAAAATAAFGQLNLGQSGAANGSNESGEQTQNYESGNNNDGGEDDDDCAFYLDIASPSSSSSSSSSSTSNPTQPGAPRRNSSNNRHLIVTPGTSPLSAKAPAFTPPPVPSATSIFFKNQDDQDGSNNDSTV